MHWESFIDNLMAGEIIPIIGNDLSLIKDNDHPVPLYHYIAEKLTERLGIPYSGQTVNELTVTFPHANIRLTTNSIFNKIDPDSFYLDPLIKLAEITDFKFFITTVLDDLLVKSLQKARNLKKNQLQVINYSLQQFSDPPGDDDDTNPPAVTVFNLLGSLGNIAESASTEEEALEHFFSLTSKHHRNPLSDYFMDRLKNKILLFLGCDFPDWFMRFIIRILTNQRYKFRIFSDYIVNDNIDQAPALKKFLEQFNKNIVMLEDKQTGNTRAFIDELHDRWSDFIENRPFHYEGSVFLSYTHPDQTKARSLKKLLRAKGIRNPWLDIDDLDAGEHKKLIEEEIKRCKVFVPIISDTSLENTDSYTRRVEWAGIEARLRAEKHLNNGKINFTIIPVVIDNTTRDDQRIPEFLRDFSIWNLDESKDRILKEIIKVLNPL